MFIYLFLYFIVFILALRDYYKISKINRLNHLFVLFIFISLGVIAGSRLELGGRDYEQYKNLFYNLPNNISSLINKEAVVSVYRMEMGYLIYNVIIKIVSNNFNTLLLITGVITSMLLYKVFKTHSKYILFSLLLFISKFYLYYFFTAQRQIIAMLICWVGLYFVEKRKLVPFVVIVLLAFTFHGSAIVFFIAYFLYNVKLSTRQIVLILILSALIGVGGIGRVIANLVVDYLPFGSEKLGTYLESETKATNILNYIEILPLLYIIVKNRLLLEVKFKNFNFFLNFFVVFAFFLLAFYEFNFISRVSSYFLLGYVFLVPLLLELKNKAKSLEIILFFSLYYLAVYIRYILTFSGGEGVYPYNSFLLL